MTDCGERQAAQGVAGPNRWLDGFALCASSLCTLHCLGLPLLFALLPAFASRIDPGESFHIVMLALAIPTSLFALVQGQRAHRSGLPLILGLSGLLLMGIGAVLVEGAWREAIWTIAGSALLALAHIFNWRRGRIGLQGPA
ncbi:MerC domain-containing protein [Sphingobium sp. BYY-5]|uniref:MerC domain-containing protein n=1 Tax=Sphingobium sp. BYY-5 TaxID=2926400 RepID=UPI001FA7D5EA|nr:MerC domain-containing protein [Sphingobium sp. BYY-5]MCI4589098.1 MerC domain-containing protein [Sphingobium sp. BYY-5]